MQKLLMTTILLLSPALAAKNPSVITVAHAADWSTLDPAYCYENLCGEVLQNTLETLVFYQGISSDRFSGLLAQNVPTKQNGGISQDGKTYTFKLRKGLKFADGSPLTASDVEYSFKRLLVHNWGAAYLLSEALFGDTDGMSASGAIKFSDLNSAIQMVDPQTIVFKLKRPFAPFLAILATPYVGAVYSKQATIKAGGWDGTEASWLKANAQEDKDSIFQKTIPLGSGPYQLERYDVGQNIVLKRNPNYWRKPASVERVVLSNVQDPATRVQLFLNEDADFASIPASQYEHILHSDPTLKVSKPVPALGIDMLYMNQKISGQGTNILGSGQLDGKGIPSTFLSDVNVRKALAFSMDYSALVNDVLQKQAIQMNSVLIKGLYSKAGQKKYTYNKSKAIQHFKAAWDGKVWENGFVLPVYYNSGNPVRKATLEILKANVEALNPKFKIEVRDLPNSQIRAMRASGQMSLWAGNWAADYGDAYNFVQPLLHSSGTLAKTQSIKNPKVDQLIEQLSEETNSKARNVLLSSIEKIAFDEVLGLPTHQVINVEIQHPYLSGVVYNPVYPGYYYYTIKKQ
ncbi:ABC transporter substrate-binding protein [Deinococcus roseus]|uniref:Peptide ABC transporter substrate-binding protein n=1 Tax=Deinococcus roseus TaxID=392414 RepID=A0ABQ2D3A9_9DEIO|nr:ABC transporter substrate-binding protein [Deinococcus roseus]GGJ44409.1 peptide ABC transporter substrate-binding protein [Deinococcus roseus]